MKAFHMTAAQSVAAGSLKAAGYDVQVEHDGGELAGFVVQGLEPWQVSICEAYVAEQPAHSSTEAMEKHFWETVESMAPGTKAKREERKPAQKATVAAAKPGVKPNA